MVKTITINKTLAYREKWEVFSKFWL